MVGLDNFAHAIIVRKPGILASANYSSRMRIIQAFGEISDHEEYGMNFLGKFSALMEFNK